MSNETVFRLKTTGDVLQFVRIQGESMSKQRVVFFDAYPFRVGQKINIRVGPRKGDWEVIGVSDKKVRLKCPISFREFEWNRFCYFVEEKDGIEWPDEPPEVN